VGLAIACRCVLTGAVDRALALLIVVIALAAARLLGLDADLWHVL
jgi:hypothetical protein